MGTYIEIHLTGELSDAELISQSNRAFNEIEAVHKAMSFHEKGSELSNINECALNLSSVHLSSSMHALFSFIDQLHLATDGLFDPTIAPTLIKHKLLPTLTGRSPTEPYGCWKDTNINEQTITFNKPVLIDLGGIAKGYAVDRAIESISPNISATVNAGGDIRFTHWQEQPVVIQSSSKNSANNIEVTMQNCSIATSANYYTQGQSSIINPHKGTPIKNKNTVSVFADNCMTADALTKVVWLSPNYQDILKTYQAESLLVNEKNQIIE